MVTFTPTTMTRTVTDTGTIKSRYPHIKFRATTPLLIFLLIALDGINKSTLISHLCPGPLCLPPQKNPYHHPRHPSHKRLPPYRNFRRDRRYRQMDYKRVSLKRLAEKRGLTKKGMLLATSHRPLATEPEALRSEGDVPILDGVFLGAAPPPPIHANNIFPEV